MEIRGSVTGLPRTITVDSKEIRKALSEPLNMIVEAIKETFGKDTSELAADVMDRGIVITGGVNVARP